jgi:hypothetical protein
MMPLRKRTLQRKALSRLHLMPSSTTGQWKSLGGSPKEVFQRSCEQAHNAWVSKDCRASQQGISFPLPHPVIYIVRPIQIDYPLLKLYARWYHCAPQYPKIEGCHLSTVVETSMLVGAFFVKGLRESKIRSSPGTHENRSLYETLFAKPSESCSNSASSSRPESLPVTVGRVSTARLLDMCRNHG